MKYNQGNDFKKRNILIIAGGIVLTIVFYINYGNIVKPLIFSSIVLCLSILYSVFFDRRSVRVPADDYNYLDLEYKIKGINEITENINKVSKSIRAKAKHEPRLLIITRFLKECDSLENTIPKLVKSYRHGLVFLANGDDGIVDQIRSIEKKLINARGPARATFKKALIEKLEALKERENIRNGLIECESKLHYILSTLQKIESIVEYHRLSDSISDRNAQSLNDYMAVFSENVDSILKTMKL